MMKMKKTMAVVALLAVLGSALALAGNGPNFPREDDNIAGYVNVVSTNQGTSTQVLTRPVLVYGLTVYASSTNAHCDLYDTATTPTLGSPKVEAGSATQFSSFRQSYSTVPLNFSNGIYVVATAGTCQIEYR